MRKNIRQAHADPILGVLKDRLSDNAGMYSERDANGKTEAYLTEEISELADYPASEVADLLPRNILLSR